MKLKNGLIGSRFMSVMLVSSVSVVSSVCYVVGMCKVMSVVVKLSLMLSCVLGVVYMMMRLVVDCMKVVVVFSMSVVIISVISSWMCGVCGCIVSDVIVSVVNSISLLSMVFYVELDS